MPGTGANASPMGHATPAANNMMAGYASFGSAASLDAAARKKLPVWIRQGLEKMEREKAKNSKSETDREARLKAALKANLSRRKAQAKARSEGSSDEKTKG